MAFIQVRTGLRRSNRFGGFGDLIRKDADRIAATFRKRPKACTHAVGRSTRAVSPRARCSRTNDCRSGGGLEAEQVVAAQAPSPVLRAAARSAAPPAPETGYAEKSRCGSSRQPRAGLGERHQVIVVHPDDVVGLEHAYKLLREQAVDAQIAGVLLTIVARQVVAIVESRPQASRSKSRGSTGRSRAA